MRPTLRPDWRTRTRRGGHSRSRGYVTTLTRSGLADAYREWCSFVPDLFGRLARDRVLADAFFEGRLVPAARILALIGQLVAAARASGRIRPDAGEQDIRVILCGAVRQLIVLDERDPAVWRRYADLVLNALRP
ncbi:hypothetical protein ACIBEF_22015 [Micromonospora sp. NPDC050795]|uniref:SbtR family transcriptional regulator n=1 Tax=Micromonospora sp. NPDC050795 TaxID=3364282 RepID=UPI00378EBEC3